MASFTDYYLKFEKMEEFIFSDLKQATTKGHANFLVAMALFNYMEMLGGFFLPCRDKDIEAKRFNFVFSELFPNEYKLAFDDIRDRIGKPYVLLRCGMTHGYLPVTFVENNQNTEVSYLIAGAEDDAKYDEIIDNEPCGIKLNEEERNKYTVEILNPRFIHDFKYAFNNLKDRINSDDEYKAKFILRASELQLYSLA